LKRFIPKAEDDITNIQQEAEKIYETLSSFQEEYLGLKNTVERYLIEAGQYLKLKAQLQDRTPTVKVQNKRVALLSKLREARASVEKVKEQLTKSLFLLPKLISEGSYLRLSSSRRKQMSRSCMAN